MTWKWKCRWMSKRAEYGGWVLPVCWAFSGPPPPWGRARSAGSWGCRFGSRAPCGRTGRRGALSARTLARPGGSGSASRGRTSRTSCCRSASACPTAWPPRPASRTCDNTKHKTFTTILPTLYHYLNKTGLSCGDVAGVRTWNAWNKQTGKRWANENSIF